MLKLEPMEVCKNVACQHRMGCWGAKTDRNNFFECTLIDNEGIVKEDTFRSQFDKTGKMQIIMD